MTQGEGRDLTPASLVGVTQPGSSALDQHCCRAARATFAWKRCTLLNCHSAETKDLTSVVLPDVRFSRFKTVFLGVGQMQAVGLKGH